MTTAEYQPVRIINGGVYEYTADIPKGCKGNLYKVLSNDVLDVPSYTHKVLVRSLGGPDNGLLFICSQWNFSQRYRLVVGPEEGNGSSVPLNKV